MTEETIRAIIETEHFDSTKIKRIMQQHEAEMVELLNFIPKVVLSFGCHPNSDEALYIIMKGDLKEATDIITLFKNRNN